MDNYNYDLKDKDTFYWIHQVCMIDNKIPFYNQYIHIPKVKDIMILRKKTLNSLLYPFSVDKNSFILEEDLYKFKDIDLFDFIFNSTNIESNEQMKNIFSISLAYFFNVNIKNIKFNIEKNNSEIIIFNKDIEKNLFINLKKFEELSSIIRLIFKIKKINITEIKKEKDEFEKNFGKVKKRFARLLKTREERKIKENNSKEMCNIFNKILPSNNFDYCKISNKNIYQFYNDYTVCCAKDISDFNMNLGSSGMVSLEDFDINNVTKITEKLIEYKN